MNLYKQVEYKGHNINIYYDEEPLNPREDFDNLGTLYTVHRRYRPEKELDEHFDINEVFADIRNAEFKDSFLKKYIALPVYLYDHGGITISTSSFSCPWDSGLFGIIAVSLEDVRKEYGWKAVTTKRREKIEEYLRGEIEMLDNYYTGEVYGVELTPKDDDTEVIHNCWGYFGERGIQEMESECKSIVDRMAS